MSSQRQAGHPRADQRRRVRHHPHHRHRATERLLQPGDRHSGGDRDQHLLGADQRPDFRQKAGHVLRLDSHEDDPPEPQRGAVVGRDADAQVALQELEALRPHVGRDDFRGSHQTGAEHAADERFGHLACAQEQD